MVLFDETAGDSLLMAVKPAGQGNYQEADRLYDMGHCTNRLSVNLRSNNIIRLVRVFAPYGLCIMARPQNFVKHNFLFLLCIFPFYLLIFSMKTFFDFKNEIIF